MCSCFLCGYTGWASAATRLTSNGRRRHWTRGPSFRSEAVLGAGGPTLPAPHTQPDIELSAAPSTAFHFGPGTDLTPRASTDVWRSCRTSTPRITRNDAILSCAIALLLPLIWARTDGHALQQCRDSILSGVLRPVGPDLHQPFVFVGDEAVRRLTTTCRFKAALMSGAYSARAMLARWRGNRDAAPEGCRSLQGEAA